MARNPHEPRRREHFLARHYRAVILLGSGALLLAAVLALIDSRPADAIGSALAAALWFAVVWVPWRPGGPSRTHYDTWNDRHLAPDER